MPIKLMQPTQARTQLDLYIDGSKKVTVSAENAWTGYTTQNHFAFCNDAGVQNAQHAISEVGYYCNSCTANLAAGGSTAVFMGTTPLAATATDLSSGGHTFSLRTTQASSTLTGDFFVMRQ